MTGEGKGGGKGEKVEDMYKASYHTAGKKYMYIFSMNPGKMVPGKNGPRKNGPRKNGPREKWSPRKMVSGKMVPGKPRNEKSWGGCRVSWCVCVECSDVIIL